jgi:ATP-binding cassette, subfamily B, bacterial
VTSEGARVPEAEEPSPRRVRIRDMFSKSSMGRIIRYSLVTIGPDKAILVPLVALSLAVGFLEAVVLFMVAKLALGLSAGAKSIDLGAGPLRLHALSMKPAAVLTLALVGLVSALAVPLSRTAAYVSAITLVRQRTRLASAFLRSSWAYRSSLPEGHLQELLVDYCGRAEQLIQQLSTIVVSVCGIVILTVAAIAIAPIPGLVTMVGMSAIGLMLLPLTGRLRMGASRYVGINKTLSSRVAQTSRVSVEIASFRVEQPVVDELKTDIDASGAAMAKFRTISRLTPMLFQYGALALIVAMIGVVVLLDQSLTTIAPVLLLIIRALSYVKNLQTATQTGNEVMPYVIAIEAELVSLDENRTTAGESLIDHVNRVSFSDVEFEYVAGQPVLRDVSFDLNKGEAIGFVGPSGGGKSTLTQLLLLLRQPTSGTIAVDNRPLEDVAPQCWGRLVGLVPQDNQLISGTVAENIRFYRPDFTDEQVVAASQAAHLYNEIMALPEGFDTLIGPGARNLSGGQRQRLGIARALLAKPEMLVLDEPTSALDQRSEQLIQRTLEEVKATTTLVIVAHRPATLDVCDRIMRVQDGTVTEVGVEGGRAALALDSEAVDPTDIDRQHDQTPPIGLTGANGHNGQGAREARSDLAAAREGDSRPPTS